MTPNDDIQIYVNAMSPSDLADPDMPFVYLMTPAFEFLGVERWLLNVYIVNNSAMPITA